MILLKNGTFINWQTLEFIQADVLVESGAFGGIFLTNDPEMIRHARVVDCTGKFITKSFACGHHHVYSALARGMGAPKKNPENFREILQYVWWTLDKALDIPSIRASALVTAMACAKNGITFVIDHHASPFAVEGSLETISQAFNEVGVGHLLCYEISDRDGSDIAGKGLRETEHYLSQNPGLVGLHASFTVGDDTLSKAVALAEKAKSGIHVHVAEDLYDQQHCMENYGKRVIERFTDAGVLNFSKSILGHCLHLSKHERELIDASPAWVVENTESNLNNGVGYFNSEGLGSNIILGTDGMHSDMLRSAQSAFFAGHLHDAIDYAGTYTRFRNVHHYLHKNNFQGDGDNNLVVLNYDTPTPFNKNNFAGHFLFGLNAAQVEHTIAQGSMIVESGKLTRVNETEILKESGFQAEMLWRRMKS